MAADVASSLAAAAGSGNEAPAAADPAMISPLTVVVSGLGGPRCTIEASTEWIVSQVQQAICRTLDIPVDWQTLLMGVDKLEKEVTLGSLISEEVVQPLQLTLVVKEEPGALLAAIQRRDVASAQLLLRQAELPGLSDVDRLGRTVLHEAIDQELPDVALAILARPDFSIVSARRLQSDTALHRAARQGFLPVCEAILGRADFTELLATVRNGDTASRAARKHGHEAVATFLEKAEAQHRRA